MRLIGLFEAGDFLVGEIHVDGSYGVFEVVGLGGADYGRSDDGLIQQPRGSNLGGWKAALASNLFHAIDYGFVEIAGLGEQRLGIGVRFGAVGLGLFLPRAGQVAASDCQAYMGKAPR